MGSQLPQRETFAEQHDDPRYQRYLTAKRTVDDRALSQRVLAALGEALVPGSGRKRVLEVACGTGTMFERLSRLGLLAQVDYVGVDRLEANLEKARQIDPSRSQSARWLAGDIFDLELEEIFGQDAQPADGLIACAFLDLFELDRVLPALTRLVAPGGFLYLPINFDGLTRFEPAASQASFGQDFDQRVEELYHRTMDEGSRRSQTGRRLLSALPASGLELVVASVSGWLVTPAAGKYPHDEQFFLEFILDTIDAAVFSGKTNVDGLTEHERPLFEEWLQLRRSQLERGELIYQTHQIDVFCRRSG